MKINGLNRTKIVICCFVFATYPLRMTDALSPSLTADFLLVESRERGEVLTNLKLQKLLYYADGWFAVVSGRPLFAEDFEAWMNGPVLPSQYHRFKDWRWRPIEQEVVRPTGLSADILAHLEEVVDVFGSETAVALELMTHREQPWLEARAGLPADAPSSAIISKQTMKAYFQSLDADEKVEA